MTYKVCAICDLLHLAYMAGPVFTSLLRTFPAFSPVACPHWSSTFSPHFCHPRDQCLPCRCTASLHPQVESSLMGAQRGSQSYLLLPGWEGPGDSELSPLSVPFLGPFHTCTHRTALASSSVPHRLGRGQLMTRSVASHPPVQPLSRQPRQVTLCSASVSPQCLT